MKFIKTTTSELMKSGVLRIGDGYRAKNCELIDSGLPFARAGNINNGFNFETAEYLPLSYLTKVGEKVSQTGDTVFTSKGTVGRFAYVNEKIQKFIYSPQLCYWRSLDHNILAPQFIYYWMQSRECLEQIESLKGQTDMADYVNLADQRQMFITMPSISMQNEIVGILGSLDDKIDLLHRQNKTLEAMAEALFRQWFIEDPDKDWDTKPLSSIAVFLNGLACQKFPPTNDTDKLPVLKIKELSNGVSESTDWASNDVKSEYIVETGDVIFAWSASLMVKIWNGERCILNQHLFKVTSKSYPKWFFLMWCKHHLAEFIAISASHATTMGHIKRSDLDKAIVLVPDKPRLDVMSLQMKPLIEKQIANFRQIQTLEKLRDTLLPKLLSGEVRVEI
ncbi:MAG: Type I restriction-modification system, specificity subunit S [Candidatus Rifleibacterium amylolyticum]|nr:MAG: Type I restriction-modification system, specificity subunit S [Candidatus Rifleibacterium amylolyticum]